MMCVIYTEINRKTSNPQVIAFSKQNAPVTLLHISVHILPTPFPFWTQDSHKSFACDNGKINKWYLECLYSIEWCIQGKNNKAMCHWLCSTPMYYWQYFYAY